MSTTAGETPFVCPTEPYVVITVGTTQFPLLMDALVRCLSCYPCPLHRSHSSPALCSLVRLIACRIFSSFILYHLTPRSTAATLAPALPLGLRRARIPGCVPRAVYLRDCAAARLLPAAPVLSRRRRLSGLHYRHRGLHSRLRARHARRRASRLARRRRHRPRGPPRVLAHCSSPDYACHRNCVC